MLHTPRFLGGLRPPILPSIYAWERPSVDIERVRLSTVDGSDLATLTHSPSGWTPLAVGTDALRNFYVVGTDERVRKFNAKMEQEWVSAQFTSQISSQLEEFKVGLEGHCYLADGAVLKKVDTTDGSFTTLYTAPALIRGVQLNANGDVWVYHGTATSGDTTVLRRFDSQFVEQWNVTLANENTRDSVLDENDNIYIIMEDRKARKYDGDGSLVWTTTSIGSATLLDFVTDGQFLYLLNAASSHEIRKLQLSDGAQVETITYTDPSGNGRGFGNSITIDPDGILYGPTTYGNGGAGVDDPYHFAYDPDAGTYPWHRTGQVARDDPVAWHKGHYPVFW